MIAGLAVGLSGAGTASAATTTFSFIGNSPCGGAVPGKRAGSVHHCGR